MMVVGEIKKIGIALAAYEPNIAIFAEQLESIQRQSFKNWICVVTFDSPMRHVLSELSIKRFAEDQRFRFSENPTRLGHKKNFERALNEVIVRGVDAIACSDQDDIWYPEKLQTCSLYLSSCPPMSLVHSDMHILKGVNKLSQTAWALERRGVENVKQHHLLIRNVVAGCSILMDAQLIKKFPQIPESAEYHDHWYALVAATIGKVRPIHQPLYAYRQHEDNVVAVSPFHGIMYLKEKHTAQQLIQKMRLGYRKSRRFAQSAQQEGLTLSWLSKTLFLRDKDFGVLLLFLGLKNIFSDPALARACFARALGKLFGIRQGNL